MFRILVTVIVLVYSNSTLAVSYALLIGVSDYKDEMISDLQGPKYDVNSLQEVLVRRGFEPTNIVSLIDEKANKADILRHIDVLAEKVSKEDTVFIYYSGHGTSPEDANFPLPLPDDTGVILPYDSVFTMPTFDADKLLESVIIGRRDLLPRFVALDELGANIVVAIDACFSGNAARDLSPQTSHRSTGERYTALPGTRSSWASEMSFEAPALGASERGETAYPYHNLFFISASSKYEKAWDIPDWRLSALPTFDNKPHGAFSDALLRVLNGQLAADINRDGDLSNHEIYLATREYLQRRDVPHQPQKLPNNTSTASELYQRASFGQLADQATSSGDELANENSFSVVSNNKQVQHWLSQIEGVTSVSNKPKIEISVQGDSAVFKDSSGVELVRVPATKKSVTKQVYIERWRDKWRTLGQQQDYALSVDFMGAGSSSTLKVGDSVSLSVLSERSAQIIAITIDSRGDIFLLYPWTNAELEPIAANQPKILLDTIDVELPLGVDDLIVFSFVNPEPWLKEIVGTEQFRFQSESWKKLNNKLFGSAGRWAKSSLRIYTTQ
ncbi:caspase family protein [Vibrio amylolyticus]|uniref:caspase family protein n=1 Tax=Vibrio amylolyticus TaxID=2847292 RepID=UPI00354FAFE8